jgi:hypothetical protein
MTQFPFRQDSCGSGEVIVGNICVGSSVLTVGREPTTGSGVLPGMLQAVSAYAKTNMSHDAVFLFRIGI